MIVGEIILVYSGPDLVCKKNCFEDFLLCLLESKKRYLEENTECEVTQLP